MKFREGRVVERRQLDGMAIVLRFPRKSDAQGLREYINSLVGEKARILMTTNVTLREERQWLDSMISDMKSDKKILVCADAHGTIVGSAHLARRLAPPSAVDHVAELGFGVRREFRQRGVGEALVRRTLALGKRAWRLRLVRSSYIAGNLPSAALHRKLGFRPAGTIPKGARYGNDYRDEIIVVKDL